MGLSELETIPETGAVFTIGRSRFADNVASHFFIRKDPVVSITCGDEHSAVICQTGRLFVFGSNDWGQLGLGHKNHISKPSCVKILKPEKVTHVACGRAHTLICTGAQKIFACGSDQEGQLGRGTSAIGDSASSPVLVYDTGLAGPEIVQIAAGSHHSLALTSDGGVFAWGSNLEGQLGLPDVSGLVNKPTKVQIPEPVKQISAGYYHSSFLTESGLVYVCGESESGKLGVEAKFSTQIVPKQMQLPSPAVHVACGGHHTIILADNGNLYCTGSNSCGQLGLGTNTTELYTAKLLPRGALQNETVAQIGCGESHTAIVTESGKLFTCGDGRHGKLGLEENENNVHELTFAPKYKELFVTKVACGGCHTILVGRRRGPINQSHAENETEFMQKRTTLPPLKVPINRPYTDVHEEKTQNENANETPNNETNMTEEPAHPATTESMAESVQTEVENNQDTATNCDSDSMNNIKKTESPVKSTEASPKRAKSETGSAKASPKAIMKEAQEIPISEESKPENDNKESESNNNTTETQMNNENNAQEAKQSENMNSEQMDEENNNVTNETIEENHSEDTRQASEENDAAENKENENEDRKSEPNTDMDSEDKVKQEKSPEKMTSGSTPPPKPPRLKSGSSNDSTERTSSMGKEEEPNDVNGIMEKNLNKEMETADESVQKREARSTKSSTKSEGTRSPRSRLNTEETIEIDKQNDKDKIIEEEKLNDNAQDDADVVQSPAPRTGKMAKIFKVKRQQAIENGTKIASNASHKSKSKTCNLL
ncbi:uncharacterized protein LOC116429160 isoform X1 [Nomia melanderi]|uniref:uncharacterized protein LOC116429160 isoform X1 n=1 Tax=Nomia melanderi TaxID=2448451 RepID=UPI003FCC53A9